MFMVVEFSAYPARQRAVFSGIDVGSGVRIALLSDRHACRAQRFSQSADVAMKNCALNARFIRAFDVLRRIIDKEALFRKDMEPIA